MVVIEMSHSIEEYRQNRDDALCCMARATEDQMILTTLFSPRDTEFERFFPTTWTGLENNCLIEPANRKGPVEYRLTGTGWIEGLKLSGIWDSQELKEKAGRLSQTLKGYVKGRNDEYAFAAFNEICDESKLGDGFVYNAIDSHLLRQIWGTYDAEWDDGKGHVAIPRNFGLPIL